MKPHQMSPYQRTYLGLVGLSMAVLVALILVFTYGAVTNVQQTAADTDEQAQLEAAHEAADKALKERDARWEECKAAGDRPVMASLRTVVCIKYDAVAWEATLPGAP